MTQQTLGKLWFVARALCIPFLFSTMANSLRFSLGFHPKLIMLCIEPTVLPPPCQPHLNLQPRSLGWTCPTWHLGLPRNHGWVSCAETRATWSAASGVIVKISPEVVVKTDAHVEFLEAKRMIYVGQNYFNWYLSLKGPLNFRRAFKWGNSGYLPKSSAETSYWKFSKWNASTVFSSRMVTPGLKIPWFEIIMWLLLSTGSLVGGILNISWIVSWWRSCWFSENCLFHYFKGWELNITSMFESWQGCTP